MLQCPVFVLFHGFASHSKLIYPLCVVSCASVIHIRIDNADANADADGHSTLPSFRYVTSLSFLAYNAGNVERNPLHTEETVYAMCLMSHWPLFSFQADLLRYMFDHLYDKQSDNHMIHPCAVDVASDPAKRASFPAPEEIRNIPATEPKRKWKKRMEQVCVCVWMCVCVCVWQS